MSRKQVVATKSLQFMRVLENAMPASPLEDWADLDQLDRIALLEMGFQTWNAEDDPENHALFEGKQLLLFPVEWFDHIPDGTRVVTIMGHREVFERANAGEDSRFGCLAYGVLRPFPTP